MNKPSNLTFEEFRRLPEREGTIYELDEGQLLTEQHLTLRHNLIRQRIMIKLMQFVDSNHRGMVLEETDFRLSLDTVRNPDVAFLTTEHTASLDLDVWPVDGAPAPAVEVISPGNSAEDIAKKTQQYLRAGSQAVWIVYPKLRLIEIRSSSGMVQVREPDVLKTDVLPGFSMSLSEIFDETD